MKKLYVVRGIGCQADNVEVSPNFNITMLQPCNLVPPCGWVSSEDGETMCYQGFNQTTGITLKPGEYTTIDFVEVQP